MRDTGLRFIQRLTAVALLAWGAGAQGDVADSATALRSAMPSLQGKVVLLDFWASWCGPCRQSFPWMNTLQQRHGSDLVVLAVNLDQDRALAEQFLKAVPAEFRIEYDPEGKLATQFDVTSMPTSFVIDRHGRVRDRHRGFREAQRAERERLISELVKE